MGCVQAFIQHLVCLLAFLTWLLGSIIIAYTLWILSTSPNMKELLAGTLPVTYVCLGLGALFFTNGLLGWMGSYRRGGCMLKMFLFLSVITIGAEIGGIISLSIMKTKVSDIVGRGWNETNQRSRNLIQEHFQCCGLDGPKEYAFNTKIIDSTCYRPVNGSLLEDKEHENLKNIDSSQLRMLNEDGCKDKVIEWMYKHKMIWIASFGGFLLLQVLMVLLTVSTINRKSTRSSSMESLDDPQTTYM